MENLEGVGHCYVTATIYFQKNSVSLVDKGTARNKFGDSHVFYSHFFETFQNRVLTQMDHKIRKILKVLTLGKGLKGSTIFRRLGQKKYNPVNSLRALKHWVLAMKGLKSAQMVSSNSLAAVGDCVLRLRDRIYRMVRQEQALSSVFNEDELFMVKFDFYRRRSKNHCSKLLLNAKDLEQFFQVPEFI